MLIDAWIASCARRHENGAVKSILGRGRRRRFAAASPDRPRSSMGTIVNVSDYEALDGLSLAGLVKAGDVGADELLDVAIRQVERYNPVLNAVVMELYDYGRKAIRS